MKTEYSTREQVEIDFWRDDPDERPGADSIENQIDKGADALVFVTALKRLGLPIGDSPRCLELGGGQGWASCVLKRLRPNAHVIATDISEHAVASKDRWERIYNVKLDGAFACKSDAISVGDGDLDFVFCFAAAHHFEQQDATFRELFRVLAPGGVAAYLYEPTSPRLLYRWAYKRVNAKRPEVPEDVLVPCRLSDLAGRHGFSTSVNYWPSTLKRAGMAAPYYTALSVLPFLCPLFPCTANFVFRKS